MTQFWSFSTQSRLSIDMGLSEPQALLPVSPDVLMCSAEHKESPTLAVKKEGKGRCL